MAEDEEATLRTFRAHKELFDNVQIEIHSEDVDKRRRLVTMTGSLHDGKLDATGSFLNGRPARLNWQRQ